MRKVWQKITVKYLIKNNLLKNEKFNYNLIEFEKNFVSYKDIKARKIVFCEGFGLKANPFFNYLPMQEAKGELTNNSCPRFKY